MSDSVNYPVEYRGNEIYDKKRVGELQPDEKPNLSLVQSSEESHRILDHIGVDHDPKSIVAEDSYNCLWVNVERGEYTEVWGIHSGVPYTHKTAVRLK